MFGWRVFNTYNFAGSQHGYTSTPIPPVVLWFGGTGGFLSRSPAPAQEDIYDRCTAGATLRTSPLPSAKASFSIWSTSPWIDRVTRRKRRSLPGASVSHLPSGPGLNQETGQENTSINNPNTTKDPIRLGRLRKGILDLISLPPGRCPTNRLRPRTSAMDEFRGDATLLRGVERRTGFGQAGGLTPSIAEEYLPGPDHLSGLPTA